MSGGACGKVWLVGAGPGDPGLLTLRGREVLENAEVIVYDRLVGPGVAEHFPPHAELVYVGKRVGNHVVVQSEIEEILLREAAAGKRVVRLKGGDPFLFGRGGEEIASLMAKGFDVEVVPGVTSAVSVPAYAGIPVTHRGASAGLHVVTAHRANDKDGLDYQNLAASQDTLVILMGAGRIGEITSRLMNAGKPGDTPVTIVENGTTARMRKVSGCLTDIAGRAEAENIDAPSIIIVGRVAALGFDWRRSLPLHGIRLWLTETKKDGREAPLARMLRDAGAEVAHIPCIGTRSVDVPLPAAEKMKELDWLVFSSRVGVANFFRLLQKEGRDIRSIGGARIAAVGPATRGALEERGLTVDLTPQVHDGENLARAIADGSGQALQDMNIMLVRCTGESPQWAEILRGRGARVAELGIYETVATPSPILESFLPGDIVVFKSASAVEVFAGAVDCSPREIRAVCIGRPTASAASAAGFEVLAAPRATDEALLDEILRNFSTVPHVSYKGGAA